MAYGLTPSSPLISQEVEISVGLPASIVLQGLKSDIGNRLFFSRLTQKRQIYTKGIYSDSVERDLRLGQTGTTYVSNNEKVVTVNADGLATAVEAGTAQITVKNGDKNLLLDVVVKPKR
jgi:methylthioribose-1-phosphate isomerase